MSRPPIGAGLAVLVAWLLLAMEHVGILRSLAWVFTDEDQVVLWLGAVDYSHLHFHEPRFYGQAYNSMFESLLAVPLLWLGVPVWMALPLVSVFASLAAWTLLAGLALQQRQVLTAVSIVTLPLLLDQRFLLVSTMPRGFMPGIFLSVAAAAGWLYHGQSGFRTLGAVFLLGVACSLNPNALLVAVPFAAAVLYRGWNDASERLRVGVAVLAACVFHGSLQLFYVIHRSYVTHPSPNLSLSWDRWLSSWHILGELFGPLLPADALRALVLIFALGTIVVLGRRQMGGEAHVFVLALLTLVVCSLSIEKLATGGPDRLFLPRARFFLGLPFAVSVFFLWIRLPARAVNVVVCVALLTVAALTFAERQQSRTTYVETAVAQSIAAHPWLRPWRVDAVRARCGLLRAVLAARKLKLSLHWKDNLPAYACTALSDGAFLGVFPTFERRRWLVDELKRQTFDRLMMADVTPEECVRLNEIGWKCQSLFAEDKGEEIVEVRFQPQTLSSAARFLVQFYGGDPEDW